MNEGMNFEVIKTSGLTQEEFAKILRVTRVTVNNWVHNKYPVHRLHADKVKRVLRAVGAAVDAGDFPVKATKRDERALQIKNVLTQHYNH